MRPSAKPQIHQSSSPLVDAYAWGLGSAGTIRADRRRHVTDYMGSDLVRLHNFYCTFIWNTNSSPLISCPGIRRNNRRVTMRPMFACLKLKLDVAHALLHAHQSWIGVYLGLRMGPRCFIPTTVREGVLFFCPINFWLNDSNFMYL